MSSSTFEELIDRAAALRGIEPGYWDIFGQYHATTTACKQAILRAMGWAAGSVTELEQSLAANTRREWERLTPVTVVALEEDAVELPLSLAADSLGQPITFAIQREDGHAETLSLNAANLPQSGSIAMEGCAWVRVAGAFAGPVAAGLSRDFGAVRSRQSRHALHCRAPASLPPAAHGARRARRGAGHQPLRIALRAQLGLRRFPRSARLGRLGSPAIEREFCRAESAARAMSITGAAVQHQPLPAELHLVYQNFIYLDIDGMEDYAASRRARCLRGSTPVEREIESLRAAEFVEYERVSVLKLRVLKLAFVQFLREWRRGTPRTREFDAFRTREGELLQRFAIYSALDEYLHRHNPNLWLWTEWPPEYRDPESAETSAFAKKHWRSVMFYQYLQWQIDGQLQAAQANALAQHMPIGLYHDLALATDQTFGCDL